MAVALAAGSCFIGCLLLEQISVSLCLLRIFCATFGCCACNGSCFSGCLLLEQISVSLSLGRYASFAWSGQLRLQWLLRSLPRWEYSYGWLVGGRLMPILKDNMICYACSTSVFVNSGCRDAASRFVIFFSVLKLSCLHLCHCAQWLFGVPNCWKVKPSGTCNPSVRKTFFFEESVHVIFLIFGMVGPPPAVSFGCFTVSA